MRRNRTDLDGKGTIAMRHALVIEDNEDNYELIKFILEANGYSATRMATGRSGIDAAVSGGADFVILDIQLPDMNGLDVLKAVRAAEDKRQVPIIAMTSHAMSGDRDKFLRAGCSGYIEKPINPSTVMKEIESIITDL